TVNLTGILGSSFPSMSGNYSILASGCGQTDLGTWTANKVAPLIGSFQATFTSYSGTVYQFTGTITQGPNTGQSTATLSGNMTPSDQTCFDTASITGSV